MGNYLIKTKQQNTDYGDLNAGHRKDYDLWRKKEGNKDKTVDDYKKYLADEHRSWKSTADLGKKGATLAVGLAASSAAGPYLSRVAAPAVSAAIASPAATAGGIVGGYLGSVATDYTVNELSNGKYNTWGGMINDTTEGYIPVWLGDVSNPGGIIGGGIGGVAGNALNNSIIRRTVFPIRNPNMSIPNNVGWGPQQNIAVTHTSNSKNPLQLYFPDRWDVINEGAHPVGIWYQGNFGVPRTDLTNPGKGLKAAKARDLFANRPYIHKETITFKKPLVTVGDVPDRGYIQKFAEINNNADGVIYNNVYDNGYNNNQVLVSFLEPDKTHLK